MKNYTAFFKKKSFFNTKETEILLEEKQAMPYGMAEADVWNKEDWQKSSLVSLPGSK